MTDAPPPTDRARVLHPLFFGLLPLFSLLSVNMGWTALREVLPPVLAVLAITGVLWLALWPLLPEPKKRGLALSACWLPFYGFGALMDFARSRFDIPVLAALVIGCALAALMSLVALRRTPRSFDGSTRFLNRVAFFTLAVAMVSCLPALVRRPTVVPPTDGPPAGIGREEAPIAVRLDERERAALPNIYFILCDAYPRADYLKSFFEYDNGPFLTALRDRGFFVADRSRSNYGNTLPSLASTLNLDYLDPAVLDPENFRKNHRELMALIQNSLVLRTLRAHGYEYVAIPSGMFPAMMAGADRFLFPGGSQSEAAAESATGRLNRANMLDITEYQQTLVDMTPLRLLMSRFGQLWWYQLVPQATQHLESLRRAERPMFVFAHLLAPHVPHAYDESGNFVEDFPPYKEGWRTVTTYLNGRLLDVVDAIQAAEPNSIILIQGDHGSNTSMPNAQGKTAIPWAGEWPDYVRDRSANLCAVYTPEGPASELFYPEVTPVNLFRILFDAWLKTDYGRLEDATWLRPQDSEELVKITDVY